jgi:hypothetical protein
MTAAAKLTKENNAFINHVDFIEDFCPAKVAGHWSPKNVKENTLTGAKSLTGKSPKHESSKNTHTS